MRLIIGLVLAAFVSSPVLAKDVKKAAPAKKPVAAKSAKSGKFAKATVKKRGKFSYKLLTYQQIVRLPKAKRAKYMKELRELLVLIEGFQNKYEVAQNPRLESFKKQVASLIQEFDLLPKAAADIDAQLAQRQIQAQQEAAAKQQQLARLSNVFPVFNGVEWVCGPGLTFDRWAGTCLLNNTAGATNFTAYGTGNENCPTNLGYTEIPWPQAGAAGNSWVSVQRACVPKASFDRAGTRQADLRNGKWLEQNFFETQSMEAQTAVVNAPPQVNVDTGAAPDPVVVDNGTNTEGGAETQEGEVPAEEPPAEEQPAVACTPPVLKCESLSADEKTAAIARFRSNGRKDDAICISGGFSSAYKGQSKQPGGCEIKTMLPHAEALDQREDGKKLRPKCGVGSAMCNPVAFCLASTKKKADGTEYESPIIFCVDKPTSTNKNSPITERCNTEYARMLEGKKYVDKAGVTHEEIVQGQPGVTPHSCDAFTFKGLPAPVQTAWDKIASDTETIVKNWCANDKHNDLQALFCTECKILSDKIFAMNSSVRAEANCAGTQPAVDVPADTEAKPDGVTQPPAEAVTEDGDLG